MAGTGSVEENQTAVSKDSQDLAVFEKGRAIPEDSNTEIVYHTLHLRNGKFRSVALHLES